MCINEYAETGCDGANGAPHPHPSADARKFKGSLRLGSAPSAFAEGLITTRPISTSQ
jgi:hypothetical protein